MDTSTLASTFFLTLLLLVGLFFFIRASTKDRIESVKLVSKQPELSAAQQLQQYFVQRSYRIAATDSAQNQVAFEGFVRPSWFMAIFLSGLAAVGLLCLSLVLAVLFPKALVLLLGLVLLSPLAGVFYWRGAARPETVLLKVESLRPVTDLQMGELPDVDRQQSLITITAHRDEVAELQRNLALEKIE